MLRDLKFLKTNKNSKNDKISGFETKKKFRIEKKKQSNLLKFKKTF